MKVSIVSLRTTPLLVSLALGVLCLSGCGSDRPSVYPVNMKVLFQGKPAVRAGVTLHPQSADLKQRNIYPNGYVDETGKVSLTTFDAGDGAPAGDYAVTVVWTVVKPNAADPEAAEGGQDHFRGAYANPATTKLKLTVKPGGDNAVELKLPLQ